MKKKYIYLAFAVLLTLFIFNNSMQTAAESQEASDGLLTFLMQYLSQFGVVITSNMLRKAAHFAEFFAQGMFLSLYFRQTKHRGLVYPGFFGLLTACSDEYLQQFFEGRGAMVNDIFIDFSGTLCAMLAVWLYFAIRKGHK